MATGNIAANTPADWQVVQVGGSSVHLAVHGTFGGTSVAVEQEINGNVYPVLDEGVAIAITAASDIKLNVSIGDKVRLNPTGGTGADIDFNIAGASIDR